jgi:hypothetical protein
MQRYLLFMQLNYLHFFEEILPLGERPRAAIEALHHPAHERPDGVQYCQAVRLLTYKQKA